MKLDCTMFENVTFVRVDMNRKQFPIEIAINGKLSKYLTKEGCFHDVTLLPDAKCVIFPKGKTNWVDFHRPFKDADIVAATIFTRATWVGIFKQYINNKFESYCFISATGVFYNRGLKTHALHGTRLATEEEKAKFFQAIKDNGYKWNAETKTLEKLAEPKFKVGDKIEKLGYRFTIIQVKDNNYLTKCGNKIPIDNQDDFILVPNKFDINTLKPFESKVLVRNCNSDYWKPAIFGFTGEDKNVPFCVEGGNFFNKCIPYEGNEYLLGTTEDCDEYYKTR